MLTTIPIREKATSGFTTYCDFSVSDIIIPQNMENANIRLEFVKQNIRNYLCFFQKFEFRKTSNYTSNHNLQNHEDPFSVYPNPASSQFTIELSEMEPADVSIYNYIGELIYTKKNVSGKCIIYRNQHLTAGTYFIHVKNGEENGVVKKIVLYITN